MNWKKFIINHIKSMIPWIIGYFVILIVFYIIVYLTNKQ